MNEYRIQIVKHPCRYSRMCPSYDFYKYTILKPKNPNGKREVVADPKPVYSSNTDAINQTILDAEVQWIGYARYSFCEYTIKGDLDEIKLNLKNLFKPLGGTY